MRQKYFTLLVSIGNLKTNYYIGGLMSVFMKTRTEQQIAILSKIYQFLTGYASMFTRRILQPKGVSC